MGESPSKSPARGEEGDEGAPDREGLLAAGEDATVEPACHVIMPRHQATGEEVDQGTAQKAVPGEAAGEVSTEEGVPRAPAVENRVQGAGRGEPAPLGEPPWGGHAHGEESVAEEVAVARGEGHGGEEGGLASRGSPCTELDQLDELSPRRRALNTELYLKQAGLALGNPLAAIQHVHNAVQPL